MVQAVSRKISEWTELTSGPVGTMYTVATVDGITYKVPIHTLLGNVFDIRTYGATDQSSPGLMSAAQQAAANAVAIQAAFDAAEDAGGGTILFPGDTGTLYPISAQIVVSSSNTKLWAPGGAKLFLYSTINVPLAFGNVDTQITTTESNTLDSNADAGDLTLSLTAGKGANFAAKGTYLLKSDAIIPDHDSAVVVQRCERITVYEVSGDTLSLNRPLRYSYATADNAQIYRVDWLTGIEVEGLGIDGNDQVQCAIGMCFSCCLKPVIRNVRFENLQQRAIRLQYCMDGIIDGLFQTNGRSAGFQGAAVSLNAYVLSEGGACENGNYTNIQVESCRHAYTTSGVVSNTGTSSPLNSPGFGVPSFTVIRDSAHVQARGAGFDTHETGYKIRFINCQTIGSLGVGFQDRCVGTQFVNCFACNTVGAAIQFGSDAQYPELLDFRYLNTNLGTDEASSTDWTKKSIISDNGVGTSYGTSLPNQLDNGGFDLWERGSSFTATGGTANRWKLTLGTGEAVTVTQRVWAETRPHAGKYYMRFARGTAGSTPSTMSQFIDDVRSFAGQTVTLSWEMRDTVDGSDIEVFLNQDFGTGGAPSADVRTTAKTMLVDAGMRRYNCTFAVPLLTGKTIGSNEDSSLEIGFSFPVAAGAITWDIDNVKLEVSPIVTNFVPRPIALEKEACSRWFEKSLNDGQNPGSASAGGAFIFADSVQNANYYGRTICYTTRKGRAPTVVIYAPGSGTANALRNLTTGADIAAAPTVVAGYQSFHVRITNSGDVTAGDVVSGTWTAAVADFE